MSDDKIPFILMYDFIVSENCGKKEVNWFYGTKEDAIVYCEDLQKTGRVKGIILCQLSRWIEFKDE